MNQLIGISLLVYLALLYLGIIVVIQWSTRMMLREVQQEYNK